jgi:DNA recombination protein RmuC
VEQLFPLLVPLLVGIIFGAATISITAWLIFRSRIKAATRETDEARVEIATLSERARRLYEVESQLAECGLRVQEETGKVATLTEQNTRLPELQKLAESQGREIQRLTDGAAGLRTKFEVSDSVAQSGLQRNERLNDELAEAKGKIEGLTTEQGQLKAEVARLTASLQSELSKTDEKIALLTEVKGKFSDEFETLANSILEDKSKRFTAQNQTNLGQLLGPLATKLQEFQKKVEDVYDKEGKDRTALATQVGHLMELNQQLSQDAHDLTRALKGSGKTQGDWGEMILERVLEMAGLRKGQEYEVRETYKREDGSRAQPDVVINLPENKHIVVDSKVSVTAYADYSRADNDSDRKAAITLHLDSVRRHIKELSEKNYHTLYDLNSLDFVIMFVPVEPAFMLAISQDGGLCESAWKKNVLLVSPTTFLFVVRTVAYLWRQEQATRNVQEIAKRGAELYDKLVGFVTDLAGVGNRLRQASQSYESARNKLVEGRGNLIRQAEMLRELGVKPTRALPQDLVESALTEQPLVLPSLVATADAEDWGEGPGTEDDIEPALDEDVPF